MSNQVILWGMLIAPWLTLFFMPKEDIKRFMPVALLTAVTSAIIVESGITLKMWSIAETVYPLNQMIPYVYGLSPLLSMWIMKYTYGRFMVYIITNAILDLGFTYTLLPFLSSRGIFLFISATPLIAYLPTIPHAALLYGFQMWQEGIFARSEKDNTAANLQPAAAKPLTKNQENKED
ncbi:MAG: hypothetical protein H6Q67_480 [Firmicutes bacterium]|nr:hypothetical protein [Bacillota bacterium]